MAGDPDTDDIEEQAPETGDEEDEAGEEAEGEEGIEAEAEDDDDEGDEDEADEAEAEEDEDADGADGAAHHDDEEEEAEEAEASHNATPSKHPSTTSNTTNTFLGSSKPTPKAVGRPRSAPVPAVPTTTFLPHGVPLTASAVLVPMSNLHSILATSTDTYYKNPDLFTTGISDCCTIATYDHTTGHRTLVHLPGSQAPESYFADLADIISPKSTIIAHNGDDGTSQASFSTRANGFLTSLQSAMKALKPSKDSSQVQLKIHYSVVADDKAAGLVPRSFIIDHQGQYGCITAASFGTFSAQAVNGRDDTFAGTKNEKF